MKIDSDRMMHEITVLKARSHATLLLMHSMATLLSPSQRATLLKSAKEFMGSSSMSGVKPRDPRWARLYAAQFRTTLVGAERILKKLDEMERSPE